MSGVMTIAFTMLEDIVVPSSNSYLHALRSRSNPVGKGARRSNMALRTWIAREDDPEVLHFLLILSVVANQPLSSTSSTLCSKTSPSAAAPRRLRVFAPREIMRQNDAPHARRGGKHRPGDSLPA